MKLSVDELREAASDSGVSEAAGEVAGEAVEEAAGEAAQEAVESHVEFNVGPDGVQIGGKAPAPDMSFEDMVKLSQDMQSPSASEQILELISKPEVQEGLKTLWYGPDGPEQQGQQQPAEVPNTNQQQLPAETRDTMPESAEHETDGGQQQIDPDVMYELLMEVLENIADQKPDMTASQMVTHGKNYEPIIKQQLSEYMEEKGL